MTTINENNTNDTNVDPLDDDASTTGYSSTEPETEDVLDDDDDLHEVQADDDLEEPDAEEGGLTDSTNDGSTGTNYESDELAGDNIGGDNLTDTADEDLTDSDELTDTDDDTDLADTDEDSEDLTNDGSRLNGSGTVRDDE